MSELQTVGTQNAGGAHIDVSTRRRISADAFRNLTSRLKKSDVHIPEMASQIVALAPEPIEVFASEPVIQLEIVAEPEPIAAIVEAIEAGIEPTVIAEAAVEPTVIAEAAVEPIVEIAVEPELQETAPSVEVLEPVLELVAVGEISAEPVLDAVLEPVFAYPPLQHPPGFTPAPEIEVSAVHVENVSVHTAVEPVDERLDNVEEIVVPKLEGEFAENFTYLPEAGEEKAKVDLVGVEEAIKREVAERAAELELENIWRLLLAKPTGEDRSRYLREAAEIHAADEDWNKPAPEHDLSRIEATPVSDVPDEAEVSQIVENQSDQSVESVLQVSEGQDMGELARSLLDMMASGTASGLPQERALAADTLLRLVPRLDLKPLIMLSQRLAIMEAPPYLLVSRLIRDQRVEVAGPLLEDCPHITDKDLESVVAEAEPAKLRMISRRRNLRRAISDALIKSCDPSVVLTLVRNMTAEISHDGFQSLLLLAEDNPDLLAPLATRQDLGAQFAFELFWLAPSQLRRFILSRFLTDSETLTKILKITMATKVEDDREAEPINQHVLLEGLERAARGHVEVAAEELSGTMDVSEATILKILGDVQGEALIVLLKTAGYPRSALPGLLKRMQDAELPLIARDRDIEELQTLFETLSFNKARILLTYWDWAQAKTGPYAPVN